jgi:type VI secretion system protein ImpG
MNRYFQNELDNLREQATAFARAYPTLAPQLATAGADPDVERILEGVAFLTAQIRQKIDDDFPEFAQGLLRQIFPHYLRPLPCSTIVQFTPKPTMKSRTRIPAGTYLDSQPVEGVNCRFRTTFDIDMWPLSLSAVKLGETSTGRKSIDLAFDLKGMDIAAWDSDSLKLHLSGDLHGASDLYFILLNSVERIGIHGSDENAEISADDVVILPIGFNPDESLLEYPSNSFPSYRLVQEYFLMKEKFLFVDIRNIRRYTRRLSGGRFVLRFYLKEGMVRIPRISTARFVLHATPAINLFEHDAESILNDHRRSEYRVRPLRNTGERYTIYSVDSVIGQNRRSAVKQGYREIGLADPERNSEPVYSVSQKQTGAESGAETWLSFSYPPDFALDNQETLIIRLTCSNGALPAQLRPGDISKPTSSTPETTEFSNILQPSEYQYIASGSSMLWRLLSHLSLNYLSLADTDNFKALLGLYLQSGVAGNKQEVANRKRIDGVSRITVTPCDRLLRGMPVRGQAINVQVNPGNFASRGDMYLFGTLLDYLFASFASLNSFTEFSMTDEASDETYTWKPRTGDRPLI